MNEDTILAVKRGAYFMDENYSGWASKIDFDRFEMSNCQQCIVGQAIGSYMTEIAVISGEVLGSHEANDWAVAHGFDVTTEAYYESEDGFVAYRELETLWTEQVRERLNHR
jgi:hypothetical protein